MPRKIRIVNLAKYGKSDLVIHIPMERAWLVAGRSLAARASEGNSRCAPPSAACSAEIRRPWREFGQEEVLIVQTVFSKIRKLYFKNATRNISCFFFFFCFLLARGVLERRSSEQYEILEWTPIISFDFAEPFKFKAPLMKA